MNELSRINYLDALGIDNYVSRSQLSGAAHTRRLALVRAAPVPAELSAGQVELPKIPVVPERDSARPSLPEIDDKPTGRSAPRAALTKPRARPQEVRFSLAAIFIGHIAWVEELDGNLLATEQVQLIRAMARAVSGEVQRPDVTQFDWPTHQNHQLDLGPEAAMAGVAGFLRRQLEQRKCRALVVLGKRGEARVPLGELGGIATVVTESTLAMLQQPACKRQVWQDLQPLVLRA